MFIVVAEYREWNEEDELEDDFDPDEVDPILTMRSGYFLTEKEAEYAISLLNYVEDKCLVATQVSYRIEVA